MELEIVNFEQAIALKKLGFPQLANEKIHCQYVNGLLDYSEDASFLEFDDNVIYAPTLELVAKWLRKEKNIYIFVNMSNPSMTDWSPNNIFTYDYSNGGTILIRNQGCYDSYESALSAGIDKAIRTIRMHKGS